MMFGALFFSYAVLRARAFVWPPPGLPGLPSALPTFATAVLLASSRTLAVACAGLRRGELGCFRGQLLATIALGLSFVVLQLRVWAGAWRSGLRLDSGPYGGTFYLLTVFHLLHVLVGLGLLARLLVPALRRTPEAPPGVTVTLAAMFWHFVGAAWLATFLAVYAL